MVKKLLGVLIVLFLAVAILIVSVLRTAAVKYTFAKNYTNYPSNQVVLGENSEKVEVDYPLAYPGTVLPDHPLWSLKAGRDALWYTITVNKDKKAELNLLFADKRLASAKILMERRKMELAVSTLTKAEKYLEKAWQVSEENRRQGKPNTEFVKRIAYAALKHRLTIEEMIILAPEDVKPTLGQIENYSKEIYIQSTEQLQGVQITPPQSPFSEN